MQLRLHLFISLLFLLLFTVSCSDGGTGTSPNEPEIVNFAPSPASVSPGGEVTLSWSVSNATSLSIDNDVGDVTGTTSVVVRPTVTTTYKLTATNGNVTDTAETQVTVTGAPPAAGSPTITSFTSTPTVIAAGGTATLSWAVTDATSIMIDNGVGDVTAAANSSIEVTPSATTTYTLTAENATGSTSARRVVTVGNDSGDTAAPSGSFGVSNTQNGTFTNDRPGGIQNANDERIVTVAPDATFYAQVAYSDPSGITNIDINLVNRTPAGVEGTLSPSQQFFALGNPVGACDLSSTPTNVTCTYPVEVDENAVNIAELDNSGSEFAYVFRTKVTDNAGNTSDEGIRGYVIVESSGNDDNGDDGNDDNDGGDDDNGNDDNDGGDDDNGNPPANTDPEVEIADVSALTLSSGSATASLEATVNDDEDDSFSYEWSVTSGTESNVDFASSTAEDTDVTFSAAGDYTLQLEVTDTDDANSTGSDTVDITVNNEMADPTENQAPTVDAGESQTITLPDDSADLNGTANDDGLPSGSSLSTTWTKKSGSGDVTFGDDSLLGTTATFSEADTYVLTLTATDGNKTTSDDVNITVEEEQASEVAVDISPDAATLPVNETQEFTASVTGNQNTDITWSVEADEGTLSDADTNPVTYTAPATSGTYTLTVTSDADTSKKDSVEIVVSQSPTADAGTNQTVDLDSEVSLDGSDSSDPDDGETDTLTYAWTLAAPDSTDVTAELTDEDTASPTFTAATQGTYTASLVVTDQNGLESATVSVDIEVSPAVAQ